MNERINESPEQTEELAETVERDTRELLLNGREAVRTATELLSCPKCARNNSAARVRCLYCGALLFDVAGMDAVNPTDAAGDQSPNELFDPHAATEHLYLALTKHADQEWTEDVLARAAQLTGKRDAAVLTNGAAGDVLPLLRAASPLEARVWRERFAAENLTLEVFSDADLQADVAPQVVRRVSWDEEKLVGFTSAGAGGVHVECLWRDIALLVVGRIYTRHFAVREQHGGRKKAEFATLDTRETSSDDQVLDIYTFDDDEDRARSAGWRIAAMNFDFGCLGARKSLIAAENFRTLLAHLRQAAPHARFDDSYRLMRRALTDVLPLDEYASGGGMKRAQFGRTISESVIETSNESQFTLYGRMLMSGHIFCPVRDV